MLKFIGCLAYETADDLRIIESQLDYWSAVWPI